MASKGFPIFSFVLIIVIITLLSHAALADPKAKKQSAFEFLKNLQGCHKGDKIKGIHELKKYLETFGYLRYPKTKNDSHANDDDFDDLVERAVKTYQMNYHLKATGVLDASTVSNMMMPRCGVPDIVNGTTRMWSGKKRHYHHGSSPLHTIAHYSFLGGRRWPATKYSLTYGFLPRTRPDAMNPVDKAFQTWQGSTHFRFTRVEDYRTADLQIGFHGRHDHTDGHPFDGRGGALAHAFAPVDGRFHYDSDEQWSVDPMPGAFHLETVALHEIGHLLGLGHSSVQGAIMFPSIGPGRTKGLNDDDIRGIRALYNTV